MSTSAHESTGDSTIGCARCGHQLTRADQAIRVGGAHVHRDLENPAGYRFTIACFDKAPGCAPAGESSGESVWFSGCTWQRAFCRGCTWHVGWLFRSPAKQFYALDAARTKQLPDDPSGR